MKYNSSNSTHDSYRSYENNNDNINHDNDKINVIVRMISNDCLKLSKCS